MSDDTTNAPLKRCARCGELKPATADFFHHRKRNKNGLNEWCKPCAIKHTLAHYNKVKDDATFRARGHERYIASTPQITHRRIRRTKNNQRLCDQCKQWLPQTTDYFIVSSHGWSLICNDCRPGPRIVPEGIKTCRCCKVDLPATPDYFHADKRSQDGRAIYCKTCCALKQRVLQKKHHDKRMEYEHNRRAKKNECVKKWSVGYRKSHANEIAERKRQERINHPEKSKVRVHRYHAKRRLLPNTMTDIEWFTALEFFDNCCAYCGRPRGLWHTLAQDHFIPVSKGGGHTADNIVPACHGVDGCNNSKQNQDAELWLVSKIGKQKTRQVLARITRFFEQVKCK